MTLRRSQSRSVRLVVSMVGAAAITSLTTGCGHGIGTSAVALGPRCVDAVGPNSSIDSLADAALHTRFVRTPGTDEVRSPADITIDTQRRMNSEFFPVPSDATMLADFKKNFYPTVPDGGNAAFASAVCDLPTGWGLAEQIDPAEFDLVRSTPHLLRSFGRTKCQNMSTLSPEERADASRTWADSADRAEHDPEGAKAAALSLLEQGKAQAASVQLNSEIIAEVDGKISRLRATPADEFARSVRAVARVSAAALSTLCPDLR